MKTIIRTFGKYKVHTATIYKSTFLNNLLFINFKAECVGNYADCADVFFNIVKNSQIQHTTAINDLTVWRTFNRISIRGKLNGKWIRCVINID